MEIVIFFTTALVAVGAALGMVLSRNAVHSALFLILNFCAVAVLYLVSVHLLKSGRGMRQ